MAYFVTMAKKLSLSSRYASQPHLNPTASFYMGPPRSAKTALSHRGMSTGPVLSCSRTLAADTLGPVGCQVAPHGRDLLQYIPRMANHIEMWTDLGPPLKPFLNSLWINSLWGVRTHCHACDGWGTLHCNEMINVIYCTCQWFQCRGRSMFIVSNVHMIRCGGHFRSFFLLLFQISNFHHTCIDVKFKAIQFIDTISPHCDIMNFTWAWLLCEFVLQLCS